MDKICVHCGKQFATPRAAALYCSLQCLGRQRRGKVQATGEPKQPTVTEAICVDCGVAITGKGLTAELCRHCITVRAGKASRKAHPLTGDKNPLWKGGVYNTDPKQWLKKWKRQYRQRSPMRFKAQAAVRGAVRRGLIKKEPCAICASNQDIEAHHHKGYEPENWLEIQWLCRVCHNKTHGKLGGLITEEGNAYSK